MRPEKEAKYDAPGGYFQYSLGDVNPVRWTLRPEGSSKWLLHCLQLGIERREVVAKGLVEAEIESLRVLRNYATHAAGLLQFANFGGAQ
jgi:hypothetical protein